MHAGLQTQQVAPVAVLLKAAKDFAHKQLCQQLCRFAGGLRAVMPEGEDTESEASLLGQEEALLVADRLHLVLRPFMLRRIKEDVAAELPQKVLG
jgi:hypothetical protein